MKKYAGKPQLIKQINKALIKQVVKEKGPISKPEISKITKLSLPTVNKIVESLVKEKSINVSGFGKSAGGRKPLLYEINAEFGNITAIFFEGDYIKGADANILGEIQHKKQINIDFKSKDTVLENTFDIIDNLFEISKTRAIGVGVPGVVKKDGTIYNIPNITNWEGLNLKQILQEKYKVPVFIENDVNLTAIGAYYKQLNKQYRDVIYIYFGKGVGSSLILNKKLYKGATNFAGEVSYMITRDISRETLNKTKQKGLFEKEITDIIEDICTKKGFKTPSELKNYLAREDKYFLLAQILVKKIAFTLINMTCVINPEAIVVRGDFISPRFLSKVKEIVVDYLSTDTPNIIQLEDDEAGLVGTINLCLSGINSNYLLVNNNGV